MFNVCGPASNGVILGRLLAKLNNLPRCAETTWAVLTIVVTKLYIGSALVSAMYGRSRELGLYLWGNRPLPTAPWAVVVGDTIFLIEWIFYWIESSQIKNFESIFELNFPGKKIIEYF